MSNPISQTQRSAIIKQFGQDLVLETQQPVKQPSDLAPGECLIKLDYAGVCHSDIHAKMGDWAFKPTLPRVGGHEGVGHVVAIGQHSQNQVIKVGDRVGLKWLADACLRCEWCRKGFEASKWNAYGPLCYNYERATCAIQTVLHKKSTVIPLTVHSPITLWGLWTPYRLYFHKQATL